MGFDLAAQEKFQTWTSGRIVFGVLITLVLFFLVVSAASYSPLDPPSRAYTALPQPVHNLCGVPGAFFASLLYRFCGYGVWFLLAALFLRVVSYWRMPRLKDSILKVCGFALMLIAISGSMSAFLTRYAPVPAADSVSFQEDSGVKTERDQQDGENPTAPKSKMAALAARLAAQQTELGPGGELGAAARFLLDKKLHIAPVGIAVFFLFTFAAGVILASDSRLLHFLLLVTGLRQAAEIFLPQRTKPSFGTETGSASPLIEPQDETDSPSGEKTGETAEEGDGEEEEEEETEGDDEEASEEKPEPYRLPSIEILPYAAPVSQQSHEARIASEMKRLQKAFDDYNCDVRVVGYRSGPVLTLYELELSKGQKVQPICALEKELAIVMKVPSVRTVFPIPGKNSVGVEIPNRERQFVRLRNVMEEGAEAAEKMQIPLFIGADVTGDPIVTDLAKLPHMLIAGRTGTGKSVCLNSIILSILMTRTPSEIRLIMIDPKMVELSPYRQVPHLLHPVVTDMKKVTSVLNWLCEKMDERYNIFMRVGVRQLKEYNSLSIDKLRQRFQPQTQEEWDRLDKKMYAIVVIADEMADMMAIAGKDNIDQYIARLAAKSRAVGIHLILATQKPTVNVVTGLIRSNLPARIAFAVTSQTDSRVILDDGGAEKLLSNGDLLFLDSVSNQMIRGQGTYVSNDEIYAVNCEISVDKPRFVVIDDDEGAHVVGLRHFEDALYEEAVTFIVTQRRGSTSLLQRKFSIGYGRAAKIIDEMERQGILGPKGNNDSKPREVLITPEEWEKMKSGGEPPQPEIPAPFLPTPEFHRPKPSKKSHAPSSPKHRKPWKEAPLPEEEFQPDARTVSEETDFPAEKRESEESVFAREDGFGRPDSDNTEEDLWEEDGENSEQIDDADRREEIDGREETANEEEADGAEDFDDAEDEETAWEEEERELTENEEFTEYFDEDFEDVPSPALSPASSPREPFGGETEFEPSEELRPRERPLPDLRELARQRKLRKKIKRKYR